MPAIPSWLRARRSLYAGFILLMLSGFMLFIPSFGNAIFAKSATVNTGIQFSKSLRIGFRSGDNTVRISSYIPGYPYLTQKGFGLPYGDYFSMAVDVNNQTQKAWGEGPSYAGPGNEWVSHSIND